MSDPKSDIISYHILFYLIRDQNLGISAGVSRFFVLTIASSESYKNDNEMLPTELSFLACQKKTIVRILTLLYFPIES